VLGAAADLHQLDGLDGLDDVARPRVVGLTGVDDLLAPTGVGTRNEPLDR
jgi:hypothetical protein